MVIKGSNLMLFAGGTSIAAATSCVLNMSMDTKESSSKDSGGTWADAEAGVISWDMSSDNLFTIASNGQSYNTLFDLMVARKKIKVVFSLKDADTSAEDFQVPTGGFTPDADSEVYREGWALITSLNATAPNGDNATMSVSFTGCGKLAKSAGGAGDTAPDDKNFQ
jgi:predicted secreted protein